MQELARYIHQQQENRKLWEDHDSPESIAQMIVAEAQELVEAIQESFLTGDVFSVASEIGDVRYLLERLCADLGISSDKAAEMKTFRNSYKYQDHLMSNGRTIFDAQRIAKDAWKGMGGDYVFSHVYLDYLAHVEED